MGMCKAGQWLVVWKHHHLDAKREKLMSLKALESTPPSRRLIIPLVPNSVTLLICVTSPLCTESSYVNSSFVCLNDHKFKLRHVSINEL